VLNTINKGEQKMKRIITGSLLGMALVVPSMAEAGDVNFQYQAEKWRRRRRRQS